MWDPLGPGLKDGSRRLFAIETWFSRSWDFGSFVERVLNLVGTPKESRLSGNPDSHLESKSAPKWNRALNLSLSITRDPTVGSTHDSHLVANIKGALQGSSPIANLGEPP